MMKEHKKLYKSGKNWMVATLVTAGLAGGALFGATTNVHADAQPAAQTQTTNTALSQAQSDARAQQQTITSAQSQLTSQQAQLSAAQASQAPAQEAVNQAKQAESAANTNLNNQINAVNSQVSAAQSAVNDTNTQISNLQNQVKTLQNQQSQQGFDGFHYPTGMGAVSVNKDYSQHPDYEFVSNPSDQQVQIDDYANLSPEIQKELTIYAAQLINPFAKEAWAASDSTFYEHTGKHIQYEPLMINDASLAYSREVAKQYNDDHFINNGDHDVAGLERAAMKYGVYASGDEPITFIDEASTGRVLPSDRHTTLDKLKATVFSVVENMLYNDGNSYNGHMLSLIQMPNDAQEGMSAGHDWFGLAFDNMGQLHFNFASNTDYTLNRIGDNASPIWKDHQAGQDYQYQPYLTLAAQPTDNTAAINNLNSQISQHQQTLRTQQQHLTSLQNQLQQLKSTQANTQSAQAVKDAQSKLDAVNSKIASLQSAIAATKKTISDAQAKLAQDQQVISNSKNGQHQSGQTTPTQPTDHNKGNGQTTPTQPTDHNHATTPAQPTTKTDAQQYATDPDALNPVTVLVNDDINTDVMATPTVKVEYLAQGDVAPAAVHVVYPAGTKAAWADPAQVANDVKKVGTYDENVYLTFPDGSKSANFAVKGIFNVVAPKGTPADHSQTTTSADHSQTNIPAGQRRTTQATAQDDVVSANHDQVVTPATTPVTTTSADTAVRAQSSTTTPATSMTREQYRAAQQQSKASAQGLPQTGNENSAAVLGLGALAGMFGLGLAAKGKKRF